MKKRITAIILSLMIALTMGIPMSAYAVDNGDAAKGAENGVSAAGEELVIEDNAVVEEESAPAEEPVAVEEPAAKAEVDGAKLNEVPDWWYDWVYFEPDHVNLRVVGSTSIKVSWDMDDSVRKVKIYRKQAGSSYSWKLVKTFNDGETCSWTNKELKKNTKYYYKVRYYNWAVNSEWADNFYGDYWAAKTRPNKIDLGKSEDYGEGGDITYQNFVVSYDKYGRLVVKIKFRNEFNHRYIKKFNYLTIWVYDDQGRKIGAQKFRDVKLGMNPWSRKWKTFTFKKAYTYRKNVNLRYNCEDYSTKYSYRYVVQ